MAQKDLSASFLSESKWQDTLNTIRDPACPWAYVRLFHNEFHHTQALLDALSCNTSVRKLFIGVLDQGGATALATYLRTHAAVTALELQHVKQVAAMDSFAGGLLDNSSIEELKLPGMDNAAFMAPLAAALAKRKKPLLRLSMPNCCPQAFEVCMAAARGGALLSLHVPNCSLDDASLTPLLTLPLPSDASSLALACLQHLDLSSNQLGTAGMEAVEKLLSCGGQLQRLMLSHNNAGSGLCDGAARLGHCLSVTTTLRQLDLTDCGMSAAACTALASGLRLNTSLQELKLEGNAVGAEGLLSIVAALMSPGGACRLSHLYLQRNCISFRELPASLACPLVATASMLQVLDLSHNPVADVGLSVLLRALSESNFLQTLLLTDCCIGDKGVDTLVPFLVSKPALKALNLDRNRIKNAGGKVLLEALPAHESLTAFSADDNRITDAELRAELSSLSLVIGGRMYSALHDVEPVQIGMEKLRLY